jgi:septal ring-binding cell division protein DamX
MRFEIKSGGVVAILFGVAALSGGVFMLGLLAGYDVGRESQSSAAQVATAYPLAAPPGTDASAPAASSVAASPPADHSVTEATVLPSPANPAAPVAPIPPVASAKPVVAKHPKPIARSTSSAFAPPPERMASASPPSSATDAPPGSPAADETSDSGDGADAADTEAPAPRAAAIASARPQPHHKPFNIQIEAAMDRSGASEMVRRLHGLGYQPHLVPAQLNGQTWYKVVIGPYPTQEAAAAAQSEMRAKYNRLYGGAASAASAPSGTSD